jgi:uncharacterized protein (TIGR02996 family)
MTDRDALLAAIHADPDDDTARLVYADWLQENGRADRAEFIRLQIEAASAEPFGPRARRAEESAKRILATHFDEWTHHLHGGLAKEPRFERGFVAHLSVEPRGFVPRAEALLSAEPVQALKLYRFSSTDERLPLEGFFDLPCLRQLRRFELSSMLISDMDHRDAEFGLLSSCPYLEHVRELSLRDNPVPPPWLAEVLRKRFPNLATLDLADNTHLGPCLAEHLPAAAHREIRRLDLSRVRFNSSEEIQRVLKSRCLRRVEELRLGIVPGTGSPGPLFHLDLGFVIPWDHLVILDLCGQWIGNDGVREITSARESRALRWLGLAHNGLGADAVRYLCDSPHLALNYLNVQGNNLSLGERAELHRRFPDAVIDS